MPFFFGEKSVCRAPRYVLTDFLGRVCFGSDHIVDIAVRFSQNVYAVRQRVKHGRRIALRTGGGRGARNHYRSQQNGGICE